MENQDFYNNNINTQLKELREILEKTNEKNEQDKINANSQIKELKEKNKNLEEEIEKLKRNYESLEQKYEKLELIVNKSNNNKEINEQIPKNVKKKTKTKDNKNKDIKNEIIEHNDDTKNVIDDYYPKIKQKLINKINLLEKEEIYRKIYEKCKEELKVDNFSLSQYNKDHTSKKAAGITNIFHQALKNLTTKERKIFFEAYNFKKCMSECWPLINE
jgi:chromosome segregation ATPase